MKQGSKYYSLIFATLMSLGMSFTMSLTMTLLNLGLVPTFFEKWARAFIIGFSVGLPTSLVVIPLVRRITQRITK